MSTEDDDRVALALAMEVREAQEGGKRKSWRKVTTILDLFGVYRLTPAVRSRLARALSGAGLEVEPELGAVERADTVRLSLCKPPVALSPALASGAVAASPVLSAFLWVPGRRPERYDVSRGLPSYPDGILLLEVNADAEVGEVLAHLTPLCRKPIPIEAVDDLLKADPQPKVAEYGAVRSVSVFGVSSEEAGAGGEDATQVKSGSLTFQLVEFLAADGWLASCWHPGRRLTGAGPDEQVPALDYRRAWRTVEEEWITGVGRTSGDLGVMFAAELARGYSPAHRQLAAWLESWELDFDRHQASTEVGTVKAVRALGSEFRQRLSAFNLSRNDTPDRSWFPGCSDRILPERLDDKVDRALRNLRLVVESTRAAMDVVGMTNLASQLQLAVLEQEASGDFRRRLELVAALLLVPTLVAGIYGANTALPGRDSWSGFAGMLVLIVVTAAMAYWLMRKPKAKSRRSGG